MRSSRNSLVLVGLTLAGALGAATPAGTQTPSDCGAVILAGHDPESHGFTGVYAGLFDQIFTRVQNGGSGILALGADPSQFLEVGAWIRGVAGGMAVPQAVTFVQGPAISTVSFSGYAILYVPSDQPDADGGITQADNDLLALRSDDIAEFVNNGGGLFGMTQGQYPNPYQYAVGIGTFVILHAPPSGNLPSGNSFDDVTSTAEGQLLGITDGNLDGCCFHNVFIQFPPFLNVLAFANEPFDPEFDHMAVFIGGAPVCLLPRCGDGTVDPGEECDDGNDTDGDGCSAACQLENACPPVLACIAGERCNAPGTCAADPGCSGGVALCIDPDGSATTIDCAPPGPYPVGTTAVDVTCSDGTLSQSGSCPVVVRDCEPPACTAPADLLLECSSRCGVGAADPAIAAWIAQASATDNCAVTGTASYPPPRFAAACAPGLTTDVVFTAADAAGLSVACVGHVTVQDTLAPVLDVPAPLVLECTGQGGIAADDPRVRAWLDQASAADLCGMATLGFDLPPFLPSACLPGAVTTIPFRAIDECGLRTDLSSTITVRDTAAPVLAGCSLDVLDDCGALPPLPPSAPSSACSGPSRVRVRVGCGTATDACDPSPAVSARITLTRHRVESGTCVTETEEVPVDCGEVLALVRLRPPCIAREPRSPRPPDSGNSGGIRVLEGEQIRLEVSAVDACGNLGPPCVVDATAPGGPLDCSPPQDCETCPP